MIKSPRGDQSGKLSYPVVSVVTTTVTIPAEQTTTQPPSPPAPPAPTKPTIGEGTWTVGMDMPAGTYRTVGADSDCYWAITKSGSNADDIISNHIGGGNLTVNLKAGQDFESYRCGTWQKL